MKLEVADRKVESLEKELMTAKYAFNKLTLLASIISVFMLHSFIMSQIKFFQDGNLVMDLKWFSNQTWEYRTATTDGIFLMWPNLPLSL